MNDFEVIELYGDVAGLRLGVVHMPVMKAAFSINVDNVRHVAKYASKLGVKTLILPPLLPYGVMLERARSERLVAMGINRRNPYVRILKHIARLCALSIISPHVLEKPRSHLYLSNLFVEGETATCKFFSRKLILSEEEALSGVKPGNKLDVVSDYYLNYTVLLGEDLLVPELARLSLILGADVIVASAKSTVLEGVRLVEVLKSLHTFTSISVVHVGFMIEEPSRTQLFAPTLIMIPGGELFELSENKRAIITVPLKVLKERRKNINVEKLKHVLRILSGYITKSICKLSE